jgi:hypothetical protein
MKPRPVSNPPNPWASTEVEYLEEIPPSRLEVLEDHSREVMARNNSPDVCFTWSVNPYRGCMHACAYCYARPTHEYLSLGAGTDFETRIVVKPHAPELFREAFERPRWQGETVVFSGVTDCYQPLESSLRLTRACLEVCAEYRNPVALITKAPLIERDLDVLQTLAREAQLWVSISLPFHNPELARAMEPYVATPKRRLLTIRCALPAPHAGRRALCASPLPALPRRRAQGGHAHVLGDGGGALPLPAAPEAHGAAPPLLKRHHAPGAQGLNPSCRASRP